MTYSIDHEVMIVQNALKYGIHWPRMW